MARSDVVWTVLRFGALEAAFTVKHELKTWLGNQSDTFLMDAEIYRSKDNPSPFAPAEERTPRRVPLASL